MLGSITDLLVVDDDHYQEPEAALRLLSDAPVTTTEVVNALFRLRQESPDEAALARQLYESAKKLAVAMQIKDPEAHRIHLGAIRRISADLSMRASVKESFRR